jgi:tetratricopeptide (TPR) repeat protein
MSSGSSTPAIPDRGQLDVIPLPRLLLELHREGLSGSLVLRQGRVEKRIQLHEGSPVLVESNRASEGLISMLVEAGGIRPDEGERATELVRSQQCRELAALLAIKVLGPKELFLALRDHVKRSLIDCFGWSGGEFELSREEAPPQEGQPLQIDLLALVQEGIAGHLRPDQTLTALGSRVSEYPRPAQYFARARKSLVEDEPLRALLDSLDGSMTTWEALQQVSSPDAFAAFWILDAFGALEYSAEAAAVEEEDSGGEASDEMEIEIVVSDGPESAPMSDAAPRSDASPGAATASHEAVAADVEDSEIATLRDEIGGMHRRLGEITLYELLGVERDATPAQIKRAYIQAAKRLHPDALSSLGLAEIKQEANVVFAEIVRAHSTLLDDEERRSYDASLEGHSAIDANQLAQAEALFRKGDILLRAGNFLGALEFLEAATRLWPEESDYQSAYAWALHRKNPPETERAREHLEKAIALDGGNAEAHKRLGLVLKELGENEAAAATLARARELGPARS